MATELEELVKKAAVEIVRDLTGSEDGLLSLSKHASTVLPSLSQLLKDKMVQVSSFVYNALSLLGTFFYLLEDAKCSRKRGTAFIPALQCMAGLACGGIEVSEPAAEALINLSLNLNLAAKMVEMGMIKTAMDVLYKPDSSITRLLVMLLVNLTQLDSGIVSLLRIEDEKMQGLFVMKLVRSFCRSSDKTRDDPFDHVGSILVNISKKEAGRKMLLDSKRGLLKQILRQFDSTSPLWKKGVFGTLRNCCFEAENQLQNLLLITEFLWPALLLPVAGKRVPMLPLS
ncbi:hypothetical protein Peur_025594 [Populus x canadensis]